MSTGPGPGSHAIGGAHVRLAIDDRAYYRALAQAQAALKSWSSAVGSLAAPNFRPMQQGLVNATNRWWLMHQAINRTTQALDQATAAAVRFNAASAGQGASGAAQAALAAQRTAQAQAVIIRANAYAAAQAALAAQRMARTPGHVPAPTGTPVTMGDRIAFAGEDLLRNFAAKVRQFGKDVGAFGQRGVSYFNNLSQSLALAGQGMGTGRGMVASLRSFLKNVSGSGVQWAQGFYDLSRRLESFDFRGGFSGKIASALQGWARGLAATGDRIVQSLQSHGVFRLSPLIDAAFGSISDAMFRLGVEFWGISRRFQGPWKRLATISASTGNLIFRVTDAVSTFGERMAIGLRSIAQKFPSPWQTLSRFTAQLGGLSGSLSSFIQLNATRLASVFRAASIQFGRMSPVFNAFGAVFSTVGSTFTSAVQTVGSVGMGIVRGALSAFGTVLRTGWNVLAGTIRGIASTIVGGLRTAIGSIGKLGVLAGGVGAAFSLVYITDQIVKMEHNLVRLQRTAGGTRAEIAQMANSFFDMGRTLAGVDLDNLIELSIMGSRLGVPRQQLDLFTRDLGRVSTVLEDIPIEEAATRFSGLIDVFQLAYPDTIKLASALNALDIASNASARDILDIAGRMSGAASTIGLTAQQTLALATAMRQARVPIETAGTAMSQILGRMTGAELPAFARVAGMSVGRFRDLMQRDALQALVAVEQGLGRMDAFGRFRALDELHLDGQRVRLVMLQLVPVLGRLNQYLNIANDEWTSTNSIMQGFALQSETARAQFQRMWNNIQLLAVSLGTLLLPVIKGLANGFGNLANDIRTFIEGSGKKLEEWGKRLEQMFENLGAVTRVDWNKVFVMVGDAGQKFWNLFVDNARAAATNMGIILIRVLSDVGSYFIRDLIPKVMNALFEGGRAFYKMIISSLPDFLAGGAANKQRAIRDLDALQPPMQPQGVAGLFDPNKMFAGLQPLQGGGVGQNIDNIFKFINNQFVAGGVQQRQQRQQREAAGVLGDILVRLLGGARGGGGVDRALGRQIGLANMEDQAAGLGGIGGGAGLGGVPAAPGAFGGLAGAMGPGGPGRGGAGVGGMVAGLPAIQPPPGGAGAWADRFRLMGMVPGAAGMAGGVGAMVADDSPRGRHMQLLAWRERVRARGGHAVNPWAAFQRNLVAMRNARFMALGGGRIVAGRNRRMDALRRLEAMRRGRMEGRMGVPERMREQFGAFQRNAGLLAGGWGPNLQFNPFANAQPNVMDMVGRIRNDQPRMRPNLVGQNAPPWVAGIADGITETLDRGFGKIARAIGIPQFGD